MAVGGGGTNVAVGLARLGLTTAAVVPSGGIFGGQAAVVNLDGWTFEEASLEPMAGVSFLFPTVGRQGGFGPNPDRNRDYEELRKERGLWIIFALGDNSNIAAAHAGLDLSAEIVKRLDGAK